MESGLLLKFCFNSDFKIINSLISLITAYCSCFMYVTYSFMSLNIKIFLDSIISFTSIIYFVDCFSFLTN